MLGIQSGLLWDLSPGNGQGSKKATHSHRPAGALGEEQTKLVRELQVTSRKLVLLEGCWPREFLSLSGVTALM